MNKITQTTGEKKRVETCPGQLLKGQTMGCCLVYLGWFMRSQILPPSGIRKINPVFMKIRSRP